MFSQSVRFQPRNLRLICGLVLGLGLTTSFACDKSAPGATTPEEPAATPSGQVSPDEAPAQPISAPAPAHAGLDDGEPCQTNSDCASGICEGQGCGDEAVATCMSKERPCTYDLVPYCGCDGSTFESSSVCPGRRYATKGACPPPKE